MLLQPDVLNIMPSNPPWLPTINLELVSNAISSIASDIIQEKEEKVSNILGSEITTAVCHKHDLQDPLRFSPRETK